LSFFRATFAPFYVLCRSQFKLVNCTTMIDLQWLWLEIWSVDLFSIGHFPWRQSS